MLQSLYSNQKHLASGLGMVTTLQHINDPTAPYRPHNCWTDDNFFFFFFTAGFYYNKKHNPGNAGFLSIILQTNKNDQKHILCEVTRVVGLYLA